MKIEGNKNPTNQKNMGKIRLTVLQSLNLRFTFNPVLFYVKNYYYFIFVLQVLASMSQNLKSKIFLHFEETQIWISDLLVAISCKLLFTNYKLTSHWHSSHAAGSRRWELLDEDNISCKPWSSTTKSLSWKLFLHLVFIFQTTAASVAKRGLNS